MPCLEHDRVLFSLSARKDVWPCQPKIQTYSRSIATESSCHTCMFRQHALIQVKQDWQHRLHVLQVKIRQQHVLFEFLRYSCTCWERLTRAMFVQRSHCYSTCFHPICQPPVPNQSTLYFPQENLIRNSHKDLQKQHCLTCCWSRDAHSFAPWFAQHRAFLLVRAFVASEGRLCSHVLVEMYWAWGTKQLLDTSWEGDNMHGSLSPRLVIKESLHLNPVLSLVLYGASGQHVHIMTSSFAWNPSFFHFTAVSCCSDNRWKFHTSAVTQFCPIKKSPSLCWSQTLCLNFLRFYPGQDL